MSRRSNQRNSRKARLRGEHAVPQSRGIKITAVRKDSPDLDRFVAALLALAMDRVEQKRPGEKPD